MRWSARCPSQHGVVGASSTARAFSAPQFTTSFGAAKVKGVADSRCTPCHGSLFDCVCLLEAERGLTCDSTLELMK